MRSKNEEKIKIMLELRKEGKTYAEISKVCGISKQRVHHLIGKENKELFKPLSAEKCVFIGLRNWMNENKINVPELTRRIYGHSNPNQQSLIRARITNKTKFQKDFIDNILKITGLTYEEAFKIEN
jgi:hypothetical protein